MMDSERSARQLFDYLRDILYAEAPQPPDLTDYSPAMRELGMGLRYLQQAVSEMKAYSEALSKGNLSVEPPPRENLLCEGLKNIHANLNHLTWQAQQVAKGDYSQSVTYMGQFSEAFNRMTDQLREREDVLVLEAHQDALTGIGNRYFFRDKLASALASGEGFLFCYCDLDHLKYVNDRFGHGEGDAYLRGFVEVVQSSIRRGDVFARIGGDEFCLLLRRCDRAVGEKKIDRMQALFRQGASGDYPRSFSCGILEIPEGHAAMDADDLLHEADGRMYTQKEIHRQDYTVRLLGEKEE